MAGASFLGTSVMGKHDSEYPRVTRDFYPSPPWVIEALAAHVDLASKRIWECACGDGSMAAALETVGATVFATDIEDRGYGAMFDFVSTLPNPRHPFDGAVTNPPFGSRGKLAEKFIEVGLQRIGAVGFLALLLPNDFDSAVTRYHLFADCAAFAAKIVLTKRVKWFEHPGTCAQPKENTSWFLWDQRHRGPPTISYVRKP
jgi:hypothetical protein